MFDVGGGELILIVLAIILLFGPKKLPEIAKTISKGFREVKRAQQEFTSHFDSEIDEIKKPIETIKEEVQDQSNNKNGENTK